MKKYRLLPLLILFFFPAVLSAQKKNNKGQPSEEMLRREFEKQGLPIAEEPSKEYKDAEDLVAKAILALSSADINKADQLINESIRLYPTRKVFQYIRELCKLATYKTAEKLMEEVYNRVLNFKGDKLLLEDEFQASFDVKKMGALVKGVRFYSKERVLFNLGFESYTISKDFGDLNAVKKILNTLTNLKVTNFLTTDPATFTERFRMTDIRLQSAIFEKDFSTAIQLAEQTEPVNEYVSKNDAKTANLSRVYFEMGQFEKVLKMTDDFSNKYSWFKYYFRFNANASLGRNDEALEDLQNVLKIPYFKMTNNEYYYLGLIWYNKQDYGKSLVYLDSALNFTVPGYSDLYIYKWAIAKLTGDVYSKLGQFERARDNYNIALLYNPDYEPAETALATLESTSVAAISIDKTSPVITLSEPAASRGVIVSTSATEIMVRGMATDPSGLKSVTINGKEVYSQKAGNFWGNIQLTDGSNKLLIRATDAAGNTGETNFEIERSTAKAPTSSEQLSGNMGKNYCLLIAAQNYRDQQIPSLMNPVQDAVRLKLVLKKNYNFIDENIITLFNPEANEVKRQLLELTNIIQPEDNLLIFYAGHGIWVEKEKKGYWMMVDAKRYDPNTWLSNKDVLDLIAKLPSRHTLLITDACFSGGVFRTRALGKDPPPAIQMMDKKISRIAITSGNDTEVPDESVFMKYLVKALSENKEEYLPAQKMFINYIMEAVMTESKTEPRYGTLELAGHIGGDYIFIKK